MTEILLFFIYYAKTNKQLTLYLFIARFPHESSKKKEKRKEYGMNNNNNKNLSVNFGANLVPMTKYITDTTGVYTTHTHTHIDTRIYII